MGRFSSWSLVVVLLFGLAGPLGCKRSGGDTLHPPPTVASVLPARGPVEGGSVVLIRGDRFSPDAQVRFGGADATAVVVADAQTLTATTPPGGSSGEVNVEIENPGKSGTVFTGGFTYYAAGADDPPAPTLDSVNPSQGPLAGGGLFEVHGTAFQDGVIVIVGGAPATHITLVDETFLTAVAPAGAREESVDLAISNPDGRSATLEDAYAYFEPTEEGPIVSGVAPNQGPTTGGAQLRITGTGFQMGAGLYVGGRPASGVSVVGEEILALTPEGIPGLKAVAVVNPDGQTFLQPEAYNYFVDPPRLLRVEPLEGPIEGGTDLVILGRGFDQNTNILIDGNPVASLTIIDEQSATARSPVGSRGGYVDVQVVGRASLSDTLRSGYYYIDADNPPLGATGERLTLMRVSPSMGPELGGSAVTLLGSGFKPGATVTIGGTDATDVRVLGTTSIAARTPAGTVGPARVEVQNTDGTRAELDLGYTYYGAGGGNSVPQISALTPSTGPTAGGTRTLLTGANFEAGLSVYFGDAPATNVNVLSPSQITLDTPAGAAAGPVNVTVVTPGGTSGQLTAGFVYYALTPNQQQNAPVINGISPASGPMGQETAVTLAGDKFQVGALVFFGARPVVSASVDSPASISATTPAEGVGPVDVTVTNPDGLSFTRNGGYSYAPPAPIIASITPNTGPLAGNITVMIVGSGFVAGASVLFAASPSALVTVTDGTVVRATVPPGNAGLVDLTVRNPDGQQDVLTEGFDYDPSWVAAPPPSLAQILPNSGPTTGGSRILLRGSGFGLSGAELLFGGAAGTDVVVSSDTEATVLTPPGLAGPVHVTFTNADGQTSVLPGGFTYRSPSALGPAPRLTGVTPTAGPETSPTDVLVTGQNLAANAYLYFGGVLASNPIQLSANIYAAQAQPHAAGPVSVSITHPDGQSFTIADAFTYVAAPAVLGVLPASGQTLGGTPVTVTGTDFQPGAIVSFGGLPATNVVVASDTILTCETPAGPAGQVEVVVGNPDGQAGTLIDGYSFVPPPAFDSTIPLDPAAGPTTGGSIIVLNGSGFQPGATVTVDGVAAQVEWVDGSVVVILTPPGTLGPANVTLTNPDGQSVDLTDAWLYVDPASLGTPPTLVAPTPATGPELGGSRIGINGGDFVDGAKVFFAMRPGVDTDYVSPAQLATTTPAHSIGLVQVAVTNPDGQTAILTDGFEFLDATTLGTPPTITLVTPQTASRFGGTPVQIDGADFQNGAIAFFGGLPAQTTTNGATQADTIAPAHPEGPALVQLTNPDGQTATFPGAFQFIVPPPTIASVVPAGGPTTGGTPISVYGSDLHPNVTVTFDTDPAVNCLWIGATQIDCETPTGTDGPVVVTVTNPDGNYASLAGGFTFSAPPTISAVSPTSGPETGGTAITIVGTGYRNGATVQIGGTAATGVTFVSTTALQAVSPVGVGPAEVLVENPDGQIGTKPGGFTYLPPIPPPSIVGLTPNVGVVSGGTNVTIAGTGFQAGAIVRVGGTPSTTVQVFSPTYLNVVIPAGLVGVVDVEVENPDGQIATLVGGFQYIAQGQLPPIAVDYISPNRGPIAGANAVTVFGRGFEVGAIVAIAGQACTAPEYISPGAINCVVPAGGAGPATVTVTNPTAGSAVLNNGYTYGDGGSFVVAPQRLPSESEGTKKDEALFDIDGDGDLDLFTSHELANYVHWNDGSGNFFARVPDLLVGAVNYERTRFNIVDRPVDVNGDGTLDLVVRGRADRMTCCAYQYGVWVYTNVGGAFTLHQRFGDNSYNTGPMHLVDVDNDGDPDLVWGRDTAERLFLNDGAGAYTEVTGQLPAVNDATRAVCSGDVDFDGDQDLLIANDFDQQKRLYLNDGTGNFTDASNSNLNALGGNSFGCMVSDIDGDLDLDIILINDGQQDSVYINDGTGHFADGTAGRLPAVADTARGGQLVDIDLDGDLDLIAGVGGLERIYLSDGNGQFVPANPDLLPAQAIGPGPYTWLFGDVDGDVYPDLLRIHQGGQNRLLINLPNGGGQRTFTDDTMSAYPSEWEGRTASAFVDVDGDGDLDLISAGETRAWVCYTHPWRVSSCYTDEFSGELHLYLNDGGGNFFDFTATNLPMIDVKPGHIAVADFDGINGPDFAVSDMSRYGQQARLYLNDGSGAFNEMSFPNFPLETDFTSAMTVADIDVDGRPDLILSNSRGPRYWRNTGGAVFVDMSSAVMPDMGINLAAWAWDIQVGDLDGDTFVDLFLSRKSGNKILEWNPLLQLFEDVTNAKMPSASNGYQTSLVDVDNDGDLDAVVANCTDDRLYLNTGSGFFADNTLTSLPRTGCTREFAVVDPNGDGLIDLISAKVASSTNPQQTRLLINQGGGVFVDETVGRISLDDDSTLDIAVGDVNGDGRDDVFFANDGQSRIYLGQP